MPGLPLAVRETMNQGCSCSQSRTDQMCRQQSRVRLTPEEQLAAEESLSVYCKPVELYNILQRRAIRNPSFLQRCLQYKIQAKRKRRIQITISLVGSLNTEIEHHMFPFYVLLAIPVADTAIAEHSAVYRLSRPCVLANFIEFGKKDQTEASFVIPEIKKLTTDARFRNLSIIIISKELEGNCLWGKIPVDSLCLSLEQCVTLSLGHRTDIRSAVNMQPSILEPKYLGRNDCIFIQTQNIDSVSTFQLQVSIYAQEVGASETSPYDFYSYDDIPTSSLPHIIRLRTGNVLFNYRYYNNMLQKTEVTEDFSCPFCLVKSASFKGLRCHLNSSHDLFNFEFWVTEEYQAVNVSVRTDIWRSEVVSDGVDPRLQTFSYCNSSNIKRRRRSKNSVQTANHVHPHVGSPETAQEGSHGDYDNKDNGTCSSQRPHVYIADASLTNGCHGVCGATTQASTSNDFAQQASATNLVSQNMLQFAKMRRISDERADPRNRALLQKRQFFHSHRAQPMALEQVFSDRDSEDEVDDDIADFEDRRMLDDFVDVTKDEKQIMHLWNSFVRKQRVLADGHIPWACEAFSQLHGQDLARSPALMWCWRLLMVKLWNHSLLDARTMNICSLILERYQNEISGPKQS
ncbi:polycomb group protein EMBRYONIC FLOWER [Musa troglodytarum]|uniref:Polycomb group protein EMBRYONIC FLOWER n=1 Tax=Musa troglodytarum TaxID=320322 RepID=A0A9E7JNP5_9LILI|nr:polycomb group protein EMBRYONIC FLOWER [Musa troglodytarum]URD87254.1 polycomb group protein EMBRYONIC FLOWER [Musa troglodytarum]